MGLLDFARLEVFINELFTHQHLLRIHWVSFGYLRNEGLFEINGMVERSLRGEFPVLWFIEDLGILGILWGEFLFHFLSYLGEGSGE